MLRGFFFGVLLGFLKVCQLLRSLAANWFKSPSEKTAGRCGWGFWVGAAAPQSKIHEGYSPSSRLASWPFTQQQHLADFSDGL